MGADTPAEGGEIKPDVKVEDKNNNNNRGRNNFRRNNNVNKTEKFMGAHPALQGYVFEPKRIRSEQVDNFEKVDEIIKAKVGADFDSYVLESLEKDTETFPNEPTEPSATNGAIGEIAMSKYKIQYSKFLSRKETIENQLKQAFSLWAPRVAILPDAAPASVAAMYREGARLL